MRKWEHKVVERWKNQNTEDETAFLDAQDEEGWVLISVVSVVSVHCRYYFRRSVAA